MQTPFVTCEVNTCTHWLTGNLCGAANIDILNQQESQMSQTAEQTECKTFYGKRGLANYLGGMDNVNWNGMTMSVFKKGQQINPSITCVVNSCIYWQEGNLCHAHEIFVSGRDATECQDTDCRTFAVKEG